MTLFKFLILLLRLFYFTEADATCTYASVTKQCTFFKNLNPNDIIELANGEKIPACTLSSVFSKTHEDALKQTEVAQVKLRNEILKTPQLSDSFKSSLQDMGWNNLGRLTLNSQEPLMLPWPPNLPNATPRKVNSQEILAYFNNLPNGPALLKLMQGADQNQRLFVALSLDQNGSKDFLRTPKQTELAFNTVKDETLQFLLQGKELNELTPEQRSLIGRVNSHSVITRQYDQPPICGPNRGQGGYNNIDRALIDTGPKMNYIPPTATYRTLAHELAHSFDPCRSNLTWFKASDEFSKWVKEAQGVDNPRRIFAKVLPENPEELLRGSQVLATPFEMQNHPFIETYNCLINQGGPQGHPLNRGLGRFHANGQDYLQEKGPVRKPEQACEFTQGNEIFCDWFAAQILARVINQKAQTTSPFTRAKGRRKSQMQKPRNLSANLKAENTIKAPAGYEYLIYNLDEACAEDISGESLTTKTDHPSQRRRTNLILNHPTVAQALGCPATPPEHVICPYNVPPLNSPQPSKSKKSEIVY